MTAEGFRFALAIEALKLLRSTVDQQLAAAIAEAETVLDVVETMPRDRRQAAAQKILPAIENLLEATWLLVDLTPPASAVPIHLLN